MPIKAAIGKLKNDLVAMSEMCENAVSTAIMALIDRSEEMAESVIFYDDEIDYMEITVDAQCAALVSTGKLADDQRRFVCTAMKITSELERIGDAAVDICEHVDFLVRQRSVLGDVVDFAALVEQVSKMMRDSVSALLEHDPVRARRILERQRFMRDEMSLVFGEIMEIMYKNPLTIERACHILAVGKSLEKVGEFAANVAGHVVFFEEGKKLPRRAYAMEPLPAKMTHAEENAPGRQEEEERKLVSHHGRRMKKRLTSIIKRIADS